MKQNKIIIIIFIVISLFLASFLVINRLYNDPEGFTYNNETNMTNNEENNNVTNNVTQNKDENYEISTIDKDNLLVLDNQSVWQLSNGLWQKSSKEAATGSTFFVYANNKTLGKYTLKYVKKWNVFNKDDYIPYNGYLIAYSLNFNIGVKSFTEVSLNSNDISTISSLIGFNVNDSMLNYKYKYELDLNNDDKKDNLICVSNLDSLNEVSQYFNLCYTLINNNTTILVKDLIEKSAYYDYPVYKLNALLRFNNNTFNNIVLQKGYFSEVNTTGNVLFERKNSTYEIAMED